MSPELITFLMLGSLIGLIVLGYPVAFVLGGLAAIFGLIFVGHVNLDKKRPHRRPC